MDFVQIPTNVTAKDMAKLAERELKLTSPEDLTRQCDFMRDEPGKRYEAMTWSPGCYVDQDEIQEYFRTFGFQGNTAAFIMWLLQKQPLGVWVSIHRMHPTLELHGRAAREDTFVAYYRNIVVRRTLFYAGMSDFDGGFVAFREISP